MTYVVLRSCNILYYFIEDISTPGEQCYSLERINSERQNYYLSDPPDGDTFKRFDVNCISCKINSDNCFSCDTNFYFYSNDINKCNLQDFTLINYFTIVNHLSVFHSRIYDRNWNLIFFYQTC